VPSNYLSVIEDEKEPTLKPPVMEEVSNKPLGSCDATPAISAECVPLLQTSSLFFACVGAVGGCCARARARARGGGGGGGGVVFCCCFF
jgi:hypothetical protein